MKKCEIYESSGKGRTRRIIFLTMKLLTILIFAGTMAVSASVYSQKTKINLELRNSNVGAILKSIEQESDFIFIYDTELVNNRIEKSISIKDAKIETVLDELFGDSKIAYLIDDRQVFLYVKDDIKQLENLKSANEAEQPKKKDISGTVKDSKGIPIPGVSVVLKGTSIGTITDINGKFEFSVPIDTKTFVVSFIGMTKQEVAIDGKTSFSLVMEEVDTGLQEVVAVGYGTQKKETVVGAISTMKAAEVVQTPTTNLTNALNGRLPGLVAMQRQGQPGKDESEIYIRGKSTFEAAASKPLTLVDGIERPFAQVDPNEVETITILKDASATAVYGVKGANGVILVTTKRGIQGKAEISFSANVGFQNPTRILPFKDANVIAGLRQAGYYNDYGTLYYTQNQLATIARVVYGGGSEDEKLLYPNQNWTKDVTLENVPQQQYNLNVRGGSTSIRYFISGGYFTQGSWFENFDQYYKGVKKYNSNYQFDRYNFRSNIDIDITKKFTATVNLAGRIENVNNDKQGSWGFIQQLYYKNSLDPPIYYPGIGFAAEQGGGNLIGSGLVQGGFNNTSKSTLESSVILKYNLDVLLKGLSARANISFDSEYDYSKSFWERPETFTRDLNITDEAVYIKTQTWAPLMDTGDSYLNTTKRYEEIGLDYTQQFGKHDITGLFLYNQQEFRMGAQTPYVYQGLVGRATYGYNRKYLAEFNVGYNGSENFAPGNRFGLFPALSFGWVLSEESWIKNLDFISWLKIRGSYGEVGNDKLYISGQLQRFLYYNDYAQISNGYIFGSAGRVEPAIIEGRIGNDEVTWERAKKSNIGIESNFFDRKLGFTLDLFQEYRDDILLSQASTVPSTLGAVLPAVNKGKTYNRGYEIEIFHQNKIDDFSYQIKGNYTFAKSEVLFIDEPSSVASWQRSTGQPIGQPILYQCIGFFQSQEDITNSPSQEFLGKSIVGDRKYLDYNKDGKITELDRIASGYTDIPEITYGLNLNCQYKNFDFSILFQGVDHVTFNGFWGPVINNTDENSWSPFKTTEENSGAIYPSPHATTSVNDNWSSGPLGTSISGAYLKLKNLEFGYSLPKSALKRTNISACRFYTNAVNLAILYDELKTIDPESGSGGGVVYPQMKTVNFGVNVKF